MKYLADQKIEQQHLANTFQTEELEPNESTGADEEAQPTEFTEEQKNTAWDRVLEEEAKYPERYIRKWAPDQPIKQILTSVPFLHDPTNTQNATYLYAKFADRLERYYKFLYQLDPQEYKAIEGRHKNPILTLDQISPPPTRPEENNPREALSKREFIWTQIHSHLSLVCAPNTLEDNDNTVIEQLTPKQESLLNDLSQVILKHKDLTKDEWPKAISNIPNLTRAQRKELLKRASVNLTTARSKKTTYNKKKFREWMETASQAGYGPIHKALKPKPRLENEMSTPHNRPTSEPYEFMDKKAERWSAIWNPPGPMVADTLLKLFQTLKNDIIWNPPEEDPILPEQLRAASLQCNNKVGLGVDVTGPMDIQRLPQRGFALLAELLNAFETLLCWPTQWLHLIVGLHRKEKGGDRAIALFPWLYRLWALVRYPIAREWTKKNSGPWDQAKAGSSALLAAGARLVKDEILALQPTPFASASIDIKQFYDHIWIPLVLVAGIKFKFPTRLLMLALLMHLSPRILFDPIQGFSRPIEGKRGLLPGCRFANDFARLLLLEPLSHIKNAVPAVILHSWVDDLILAIICASERGVAWGLTRALITLIREFQGNLLLEFANKSFLLASSKIIAHYITCTLKSRGLTLTNVISGTDLGLDRTAKPYRVTPKLHKQMQAATDALRKLRQWSRSGRQTKQWTRRVALSGLFMKAIYSARALGMPPSQILQLRRKIAPTFSGPIFGRCTSTAFALVGDHKYQDPYYEILIGPIRTWLQLWQTDPEIRAIPIETWQNMTDQLVTTEDTINWAKVKGLMAAAQANLLTLGWDPHRPDSWESPEGKWYTIPAEHLLLGKYPWKNIYSTVLKTIETYIWKKASSYTYGPGLEGTPDLHTPMKKLRDLEDDPQRWGTMYSIFTISYWTRSRKFEAGYIESPTCPYCLGPPETAYHRFWECPCFRKLPAVIASGDLEHMAKTAITSPNDEFPAYEALWLRGIPPRLPYPLEPPIEEPYIVSHGSLDWVKDYLGWIWVFGDGSGGKHASDPRICRAGWGLAVYIEVDGKRTLVYTAYGPLPGEEQTNNRAEVLALLAFIAIFKDIPTTMCVFNTDSKYVISALHKLVRGEYPETNTDLFNPLSITGRADHLLVNHVFSHLLEIDEEAGHITYRQRIGNKMADELAEKGAALHEVSADYVARLEEWDDRAIRTQTRLLAIQREVLSRDPEGCTTDKKKRRKYTADRTAIPPIEEGKPYKYVTPKIEIMSLACKLHAGIYLTPDRKLMGCLDCGRSSKPTLQDAQLWVTSHCTPCPRPPPSPDNPFPHKVILPSEYATIIVKGKELHPSHTLAYEYRDRTWICLECGHIARTYADELLRTCKTYKFSTEAGKMNLAILRKHHAVGNHKHAREKNLLLPGFKPRKQTPKAALKQTPGNLKNPKRKQAKLQEPIPPPEKRRRKG